MSQTPETSESPNSSKKTESGSPENDTKSVEHVEADILFVPAPPMEFLQEQELVQIACTTCKQVTQQFDYKVAAMPADLSSVKFDPEFMAAMGKLVRRIVFCTHCGNYRLTS